MTPGGSGGDDSGEKYCIKIGYVSKNTSDFTINNENLVYILRSDHRYELSFLGVRRELTKNHG
jgi:hypothetical protein